MPRYVALLSSVNVGGNRVGMADLRAALEACGLGSVSTVTASGNAIFETDRPADRALAGLIGDCVADRFGFRTFAAIRSAQELKAAIAECPFRESGEARLVHVHFLENPLKADAYQALLREHEGKGRERLAPGHAHVHIDYVDGAGRSRVTAPFLEKHLGCRGTARNLRSLGRIVDAMEAR